MSLLNEPLLFAASMPPGTGFGAALQAHREVFRQLDAVQPAVDDMVERLTNCLSAGGKLLVCGAGRSGPVAQLVVGRLVGRDGADRRALAVVSLNADGVLLGALAGLVGPVELYARQVQALGRPGDTLLVLADRGLDPGVAQALRVARDNGLTTLALLGGLMPQRPAHCHLSVSVVDADDCRLSEALLFLVNVLCTEVEQRLGLY